MYLKKGNKTALLSQQLIAEALFSLMKEKPFQRITVKEICQKADVGRKTFYRNFELREDVVDFCLDQMCAQYHQEIQEMGLDEQLRHHFEFIKSHADCFILLHHHGFQERLHEKFAVLLPETMPIWSEDPVEQRYRSEYIVSGIEAVSRVWISRNYAESVDEIVQIAQRVQIVSLPPLQR